MGSSFEVSRWELPFAHCARAEELSWLLVLTTARCACGTQRLAIRKRSTRSRIPTCCRWRIARALASSPPGPTTARSRFWPWRVARRFVWCRRCSIVRKPTAWLFWSLATWPWLAGTAHACCGRGARPKSRRPPCARITTRESMRFWWLVARRPPPALALWRPAQAEIGTTASLWSSAGGKCLCNGTEAMIHRPSLPDSLRRTTSIHGTAGTW
mmetsp:Transcript_36491/g.100498  ORF Transcript_36491/g.100498 Transcript_36491/m.100498 type:complete len:213 (-) Transcript_36491:445-1083(-)